MRVELLHTPGCSHAAQAEALVREVLRALAPAATLEVTGLTSQGQAVAAGFAGSPTIRVNGVDLESDATPITDFG